MQCFGSLTQSVLHLNLCHASHPIGGDNAKPLSRHWENDKKLIITKHIWKNIAIEFLNGRQERFQSRSIETRAGLQVFFFNILHSSHPVIIDKRATYNKEIWDNTRIIITKIQETTAVVTLILDDGIDYSTLTVGSILIYSNTWHLVLFWFWV